MGHAEDKRKAQEWARMLQRSSNFVVFDTDHTGYNDDARFTGITVTSASGKLLFSQKIPPKRTKGYSFRKLLTDLEPVLANRKVVTYNADFRERIIIQTCEVWGCNWEFYNFDCLMLRYSAFVGVDGLDGDYQFQKLPKTGSGEAADCISVLNMIKTMADSQDSPSSTSWTPSEQPEPEWKKLPNKSIHWC